MILEGKLLAEVTNEEIEILVTEHITERQHLEFKVAIEHKSDDDRFETLCDIASLANSGGGYLIIGIRDDGKGRAQKFETLEDTTRIIKSIQSLCLDHIKERIDGLEIDSREIKGNKIVIVRVPDSSRIPHMVSYKNNTHFVMRYNDGKREMTIGEIRQSFTENFFSRRLLHIEDGIKAILKTSEKENRYEIIEALEKGAVSDLDIEDGYAIAQGATKRFMSKTNTTPFLRLSITPIKTNRNLINVDSKEIRELINNPPGQRHAGWNMSDHYSSVNRFAEGIVRGNLDGPRLTLLQNGHMEFVIKLDYGFSWNQPESEYEKNPLLYPYPVVEYPATFYRLYKDLIGISKQDNSYIISMQYFNFKGYILRPYSPSSLGFKIPRIINKPFQEQNFLSPLLEASPDFNPDVSTFELLKILYATFGHTSDTIPFYKEDEQRFEIS